MGEWSVSGGESSDRGSGEDPVLGGKRGKREEIQKFDDRGFRGWMAQRLRCLRCVFEDAETPRTKDQIIARYRGRTDRRVNSVEPARLSVLCSSHFTAIGFTGRD